MKSTEKTLQGFFHKFRHIFNLKGDTRQYAALIFLALEFFRKNIFLSDALDVIAFHEFFYKDVEQTLSIFYGYFEQELLKVLRKINVWLKFASDKCIFE